MLRTWKCAANSWFSSTLTFTSFHLPPASASSFSSIGPRLLQGPHHGAQKSTSTGASVDAVMTSCSKVARVVSIASSSIKRFVIRWCRTAGIQCGAHAVAQWPPLSAHLVFACRSSPAMRLALTAHLPHLPHLPRLPHWPLLLRLSAFRQRNPFRFARHSAH